MQAAADCSTTAALRKRSQPPPQAWHDDAAAGAARQRQDDAAQGAHGAHQARPLHTDLGAVARRFCTHTSLHCAEREVGAHAALPPVATHPGAAAQRCHTPHTSCFILNVELVQRCKCSPAGALCRSTSQALTRSRCHAPPPNAYPQGAVTHNGHAQSEFCVARASAYVDQIDAHLPALTVRETLNFAESCLGPSPIAEGLVVAMLNWEKEQEVEHSEEDAQVCCALSMLEMLCCAAAASQTPHAASFEYGTVC